MSSRLISQATEELLTEKEDNSIVSINLNNGVVVLGTPAFKEKTKIDLNNYAETQSVISMMEIGVNDSKNEFSP